MPEDVTPPFCSDIIVTIPCFNSSLASFDFGCVVLKLRLWSALCLFGVTLILQAWMCLWVGGRADCLLAEPGLAGGQVGGQGGRGAKRMGGWLASAVADRG